MKCLVLMIQIERDMATNYTMGNRKPKICIFCECRISYNHIENRNIIICPGCAVDHTDGDVVAKLKLENLSEICKFT